MKRVLNTATVLVASLVATGAVARQSVPVWPDSFANRVEALAILQGFNADLLSHPSATLTIQRWCDTHHLAPVAKIVANQVTNASKPLPRGARAELGIGADEPVRYRRVQLACGERVLSEADNWYVPSRLTAAMNHRLETTDTPFGIVVKPLNFRRQTLEAKMLWQPLPEAWEMTSALTAIPPGPMRIPHDVLQHRAVLRDEGNHPFSLVVETYTSEVLAFPLLHSASASSSAL
jgi:hypothetical protein